MYPSSKHTRAFTFIELLVTMAMIAILASLAYPTFISILERARKTQAKNDLTQIVTAVNGYYTEYGRYPIDPAAGTVDVTYGETGATYPNNNLFDVLRNITTNPLTTTLNARGIVFIQPPISKAGNIAGLDSNGVWFDPWGKRYNIKIDGTYDNQVPNPYSVNAGPTPLQAGVIAWSFGKDLQSESLPGPAPDKNAGKNPDDIPSWQ
jgi:prepilin-type N-terminal cleavage/methylation domain-containing protein